MTRRLAVLLPLAAAAAAASGSSVSARESTTGPGPFALVRVGLTNSSVRVARPSVFRGTTVEFFVVNDGQKARNFGIVGRRTRLLKPGQRQRLYHFFKTRGRFPWSSLGPGGKTVRGTFIVT